MSPFPRPDVPAARPLEPPGVWVELLSARRDVPCPGLFLDRDGVVIEDRGYIRDPAEIALRPGIGSLIAQARQKGWAVAVVTNQSGIARGLFGWDDFAAVQAEMMRQLAAQDVAVDAVAACPFHPDFTAAYDDEAAQWRK
ncbi:MAG: HAD-IIIA family hydrolase, partial [Alphaproteobacteria bacterium]|nr:HAD-IIIA family hydrolase [Alphaproteobacteria bacterium]